MFIQVSHTILSVSCVFRVSVDWTLFRGISTCSSGLNERNITVSLYVSFCRLQSSQFQAAAMSVSISISQNKNETIHVNKLYKTKVCKGGRDEVPRILNLGAR